MATQPSTSGTTVGGDGAATQTPGQPGFGISIAVDVLLFVTVLAARSGD